MDQDQIAISNLVCLPLRVELNGKSVEEFAREFGSEQQVELGTISPASIADHVVADRSLIEIWLNWSGDTRTGGGAYFDKVDWLADDSNYVVGFSSAGQPTSIEFEDAVEACALFIYQELRTWLRRLPPAS